MQKIYFLRANVFPRLTSATPIRINPEAMKTVIVSGSSRKYQPSNIAIMGFMYA